MRPICFHLEPSGGIFYPQIVTVFSLPFAWIPLNPIDLLLLTLIPQPLASISQIPYSPSAISYSGSISPTVVIAYVIVVKLIFMKRN